MFFWGDIIVAFRRARSGTWLDMVSRSITLHAHISSNSQKHPCRALGAIHAGTCGKVSALRISMPYIGRTVHSDVRGWWSGLWSQRARPERGIEFGWRKISHWCWRVSGVEPNGRRQPSEGRRSSIHSAKETGESELNKRFTDIEERELYYWFLSSRQ